MTDEFLQKYKELEQLVAEQYPVPEGSSAVWALGDVHEFIAFRPQLTAIREIRNFLSHQPSYENQPLIEPTEAAFKILNNIIAKLSKPQTIYNICIKPNTILSAKIDDQVIPVQKLMAERNFRVIPILELGRVTGVFFDSIKNIKDIDGETTFYQLKSHIGLESHVGKDILFMQKDASIDHAKEKVAEAFLKGSRVAAIFVTETGKQTEALLGLLLPLQLV